MSSVHRRARPAAAVSSRTFTQAPLAMAVHILLAAGAVTMAGWTPAAVAQAAGAQGSDPAHAVRHYHIAPGALSSVLTQLSVQAGIELAGATAEAQGMHSPGVEGSHSVESALGAALTGTGLEAVAGQRGGYVLRPRPVVAGSNRAVATLQDVVISGKAEGSTTEGSGSYTTWSTSSSTRLNLTLEETPQPITVITRQRIEDQGLTSLIDVLEATSGVTVKSFGMGADSPQIMARGANITNFQIDGVSSASAMSNYVQSSVIYDRVEVVKGATGMMSGLGTPAATVNMIRKRPTAEPLTSLSAEVGNWSRYGAGLDMSRALNEDGSVRGRIVADYKRQGAWASNYRQDYGVLYGIGEVDLSDRTLLTAGFSHVTRNTDAPMRVFPILYTNGQPTGAGPEQANAPSWSFYDHQHSSVFGSVEHRFDSGWSTKAELTHARYKYDGHITSLAGAFNQATGSGMYSQSPLWTSEANQTSLDAYVTGPFSLWGRRHELIAGVTLSTLEQKGPGYGVIRQNIVDPFNWANEAVRPVHTQTSSSKTRENQYSAYLSTRLQLSDATSLLLGSRMTDWKRDRRSQTLATGATSETNDRERNVIIPYVGLVHALNDTYSLYASYTKIFNPQAVSTRDLNNQPLDPEEGTGYEAGLKASFYEGALTSSLSVFRTERDNLAQWNGALFAYEALHNATTEGVEAELNGQLLPGWQFSLGYSYSETRNKDDQRIMTRIPRNTLKLFTTYRLPGAWNRLTVGGGINWESKTGDPLATYTQDPYAVVNLMARYQVNKQLALTAHVNNVFDKRYYLGLAGSDGFFGAPRNVMVSAKYNF